MQLFHFRLRFRCTGHYGYQPNQFNTFLNHRKVSTRVAISFKGLPTNLKNSNIDVSVWSTWARFREPVRFRWRQCKAEAGSSANFGDLSNLFEAKLRNRNLPDTAPVSFPANLYVLWLKASFILALLCCAGSASALCTVTCWSAVGRSRRIDL